MTILYKPVLIESAEQAEALPIGTVVRIEYTEHGMTDVTVRVRGGWDDNHPQAAGPLGHGEVIGWTALVPIEAKEEFVREIMPTTRAANPETVHLWRDQGLAIQSRLVTPWEEA